jgi:hypothetical protein
MFLSSTYRVSRSLATNSFALARRSLAKVARPDAVASSRSEPADSIKDTISAAQNTSAKTESDEASAPRLTLAERDTQLQRLLEERSGDGGAAGLELENGEPVAMKRGGEFTNATLFGYEINFSTVKANMFRYI